MKTLSVIIAAGLWAISSAAIACSCIYPPKPIAEFAAQTDVIFHGLVTDVTLNTETVPMDQTIAFSVMRYYKRHLRKRTITVNSSAYGASCGAMFEVDKFYLVNAMLDSNGSLTTGLCLQNAYSNVDMFNYLDEKYGSNGHYDPSHSVNVEQELCYVKIKQAYDEEVFTGKFEFDEKCNVYKERYDNIYRVKIKPKTNP